MKLYRDYQAWPGSAEGCVLAIGNFDGMHVGHQALIGQLVARAKASNASAAVMSFYPHPKRFFAPNMPPQRLSSFRQRAAWMRALGVDVMLMQRFNVSIAHMSAEDFIGDVLAKHMHARHVMVGDDFRFGKGRAGDVDMLRAAGERNGFDVSALPDVTCGGVRCASRAVRLALKEPNLSVIYQHMGRNIRLDGRVMHGDKRGRTIGFPTANIAMPARCLPAYGVYAVRVHLSDGSVHNAVANMGVRPTVAVGDSPRLEVHLFDWDGDLYGHYVEVELVAFLRPEQAFDSLESLTHAIEQDAQAARLFLRQEGGA